MTGATLGELLPYALGVAISPIPVIAVILMLLAPRAGGASAGLLVGWVAGILIATVVLVVLAGQTSIGSEGAGSTSGGWTKVALGVLLLAVARRQWRGRPQRDEPAHLPQWMRAIDKVTPGRAAALGFGLAALNPKNLLLIAAAAVVVAGAGLSTGEGATVIAVFTVLAASTVLVPVVAYAVARDRMRDPLDRLKVWLEHNNALVMGVLLLVLGVVVLGKGLTALSL